MHFRFLFLLPWAQTYAQSTHKHGHYTNLWLLNETICCNSMSCFPIIHSFNGCVCMFEHNHVNIYRNTITIMRFLCLFTYEDLFTAYLLWFISLKMSVIHLVILANMHLKHCKSDSNNNSEHIVYVLCCLRFGLPTKTMYLM